MKKVLSVIAITMFALSSCNKETIEPVVETPVVETPVDPVVEPEPVAAFSGVEFVISTSSSNANLDISILNSSGDEVGSNDLSDNVVSYNNNDEAVGATGMGYQLEVNTGDVHTIEIYSGGNLIYKETGLVVTMSGDGVTPYYNDSNSNITTGATAANIYQDSDTSVGITYIVIEVL